MLLKSQTFIPFFLNCYLIQSYTNYTIVTLILKRCNMNVSRMIYIELSINLRNSFIILKIKIIEISFALF